MASLSARTFICIAIACMVLLAPASEALQCPDVIKSLLPCAGYLTGNGAGRAPAPCCAGVNALNRAASAPADRRNACACIKSYASGVSNLNFQRVASLPGSCGVHLSFVPSVTTDCSKVA
ncbi:non-specific lipid-transfer protein-like [Nymphaea colorata]|nr:non-specific lipid-transfer protein-like [Nymphaea colorata]